MKFFRSVFGNHNSASLPGLPLAACLLLLAAGCRRPPTPAASNAAGPRIEEIAGGSIQVRMIAEPARVELDRVLLLTIRVSTPSNLAARLPALSDRCQGFSLNGAGFERPPRAENGRVISEHCFNLTPLLAREYRLAPMALAVAAAGAGNAATTWVVTRSVVFETAPLLADKSRGAVGDLRGPVWIRPDAKTALLYCALGAAVLAAAWLLWLLSRRIRREIRLRRMSPRERALHDLAELMTRDLVAHDQVKEFYFELTLIVRRYIERAHGIRAPEQTTEEFLAAAGAHPRFPREAVSRLENFLQAADLVKYAAFRPERPAVDRAYQTAKEYVETDAASVPAADTNEGGHV